MDISPRLCLVAEICVEGISMLVKKMGKDWTADSGTSLEAMLGLRDSLDRLKEWMPYLSQVERHPSWSSDDQMSITISKCLHDLVAQITPVAPADFKRMLQNQYSFVMDEISDTASSQHPSSRPLSDDVKEAEENISDIVTCLCSYKTALRILSDSPRMSSSSHQFADLINMSFGEDPMIDFKPEPLERSESDLFKMWRRWEHGNKAEGGSVSQRESTKTIPKIRVTSDDASDSGEPVGSPASAGTLHGDAHSAVVSTGASSEELKSTTTSKKAESKRKSFLRSKKIEPINEPMSSQIEPPPSYQIAMKNPPPPLGHVCWMNTSGRPPPYSLKASGEVRRKMVIVGDGAVGKTCANIVWCKGTFPEVYVPTVFENYVGDVFLDQTLLIELALWDTAGQEDYDRLRPLSYPDSHVIVICYSIDSPASLDDVQEKWISEVLHFNAGLPIVLAGLKADLREDKQTKEWLRKEGWNGPCTFKDGLKVAKKIGANAFVETSAKYGQGINELYETATRLSITHGSGRNHKDPTKCTVM